MGSQARQALGLTGAPCRLQNVSTGHEGHPSPLFLTHVKAQLAAGVGCPVQELFVAPALWPPRRFILTWIGSFFIASRNSAWLKAYGVNQQKHSQLLNWEVAPDVYKTWPGSEQQSQHMPVQPQKACQKPPPPQRRLGKQGQRPRTVKSFHPQHQSLRADCLGMLFLKLQKIKWTPGGGGQACTPGALLVAHQALSASWGTLRLSEGTAPHHAPAIKWAQPTLLGAGLHLSVKVETRDVCAWGTQRDIWGWRASAGVQMGGEKHVTSLFRRV